MNFNRIHHLRLMDTGNPQFTIDSLLDLSRKYVAVINQLKNNPNFQNIITKSDGVSYFSTNELKIDSETNTILSEYFDALDIAKTNYIKSTIAHEYPAFSGVLSSEEITEHAVKVINKLTNDQIASKIGVLATKVNEKGEEEYFLNVQELVRDRNPFPMKDLNAYLPDDNKQEIINNINVSLNYVLKYNPFNNINKNLKEEFLEEPKTSDFFEEIKEEMRFCVYYKKLRKVFEKTGAIAAEKVNRSLKKLGEEYGLNFHISPSISERTKATIDINDYNRVVKIIEETLEAPDLMFNMKGKQALPMDLSILSISSRFKTTGGYFCNGNRSSVTEKKFITMRYHDLTKTTLLHEIAHCRDAMVSAATIGKVVDTVKEYRREKGLSVIDKSNAYASEEFMKEIILSNNGVHKYTSYLDKIEEPTFQGLLKNARELFNLQMFGKKEIDHSELDVSENYKKIIQQVNKVVAKKSFDELLNSEAFKNNGFFKAINGSSILYEKMLNVWTENIAQSGLGHIAVANIKNENINQVNELDICIKEKVNAHSEDSDIIYLTTHKRKIEHDLLTPEKNFFINELKRVAETFVEDANKYVAFIMDHEQMGDEVKRLSANFTTGVSKIENVSSIILSKAFDAQEVKEIVDTLPREELPSTIACFKEQEMIVAPLNFKIMNAGLEGIFKKDYASSSSEYYVKSVRELFARNSENSFFAVNDNFGKKQEAKKKSFFAKAISLVNPKLINEQVQTIVKSTEEAIDPTQINPTVQLQILETEAKISSGIKTMSSSSKLLDKYFEKNIDKLAEIVNFGSTFNANRDKIALLRSGCSDETKEMRELFDQCLIKDPYEGNDKEKKLGDILNEIEALKNMTNLIKKSKERALLNVEQGNQKNNQENTHTKKEAFKM